MLLLLLFRHHKGSHESKMVDLGSSCDNNYNSITDCVRITGSDIDAKQTAQKNRKAWETFLSSAGLR